MHPTREIKSEAVFSLVNLQTHEQLQAQFPVDYGNKSASDVYTETKIYLLKVKRALSIYADSPVAQDIKFVLSALGTSPFPSTSPLVRCISRSTTSRSNRHSEREWPSARTWNVSRRT